MLLLLKSVARPGEERRTAQNSVSNEVGANFFLAWAPMSALASWKQVCYRLRPPRITGFVSSLLCLQSSYYTLPLVVAAHAYSDGLHSLTDWLALARALALNIWLAAARSFLHSYV